MEASPNPHRSWPAGQDGSSAGEPRPSAYVEKLRVPVRLSQPQSEPRDGWLLLLPRMEQEFRPETVLDLLNSPRSVVPFIQAGDSTVLLLNRVNIGWVAVSGDAPADLVAPPVRPPGQEQRVEFRFLDESRVEARIRWASPDGSFRLSDYLNSNPGFIAVEAGFGTLIVNTGRIRETRVTGSPSRVPAPLPR